MILVVGQTLVNLSPGQVWKAAHDVIDGGTVGDQNRPSRAPQSECPPRSHCRRGLPANWPLRLRKPDRISSLRTQTREVGTPGRRPTGNDWRWADKWVTD